MLKGTYCHRRGENAAFISWLWTYLTHKVVTFSTSIEMKHTEMT